MSFACSVSERASQLQRAVRYARRPVEAWLLPVAKDASHQLRASAQHSETLHVHYCVSRLVGV